MTLQCCGCRPLGGAAVPRSAATGNLANRKGNGPWKITTVERGVSIWFSEYGTKLVLIKNAELSGTRHSLLILCLQDLFIYCSIENVPAAN